MTLSRVRLIDLERFDDERGSLVALREETHLPFTVRESYFIFGTAPDTPRGFHAHETLEQVLVCAQGTCDLVFDDGQDRMTVRLDTPARGVHVGPMLWREMHNMSADCVLLVYASAPRHAAQPLRDYAAFLALAAKKKQL